MAEMSAVQAAPEATETTEDAARYRALEALGEKLARKRDKAIDARTGAGIDQRWFDDIEAYEGRDEVSRAYAGLRAQVQGYLQSTDPSQGKKRSTLVINVTRSKVDTSAARRQDIALPSDDRNWALRPSTVPELVEQMTAKHAGLYKNGAPIMVTDNGAQRQATMADLAKLTQEKADKAAKKMQDEIDDQLDMSDNGCGIEGVLRQIIHDESKLGVGIIKGPTLSSRIKKVWVPISADGKTVHTLSRIQDKKPISARVDPWDFYPDPDCGESVRKGSYTFERSRVNGREIRNMAGIEGYLIPQLRRVLMEGPKKAGEKAADKPGEKVIAVGEDTMFEQWEYHGELTQEELEAAEVNLNREDVFKSYSACVIMINDTVVKADIELLDTEELPYDVYCTNPVSGSWDGYGMSFLSRSAQKAITAGWRAMLDNAGQFVGGQIVINRHLVTPADGRWELSGMKAWFVNEKEADVAKAFAVHEIPAHQAEYANIIKMGMDFLDRETALPMLAQGEQGEATDVLGGMNLLLNASNVIQKRALKCLDDQVTIPHIGRYVDWNMQYNPKQEIKGDFEVQARASGALFEQDLQNRAAGNLLALAGNPAFAMGMKKWEAVRRVVRAMKFDPKDFVETDQVIEERERKAAEQGPQDPKIILEQMRGEISKQLEQMRQEFAAVQNDKDRAVEIAIAMIDEQMLSAELSSAERQLLGKLKTDLADTAIKVSAQQKINRDNQLLDLHKTNTAQLSKPPTEPAGRAKPGRAYSA